MRARTGLFGLRFQQDLLVASSFFDQYLFFLWFLVEGEGVRRTTEKVEEAVVVIVLVAVLVEVTLAAATAALLIRLMMLLIPMVALLEVHPVLEKPVPILEKTALRFSAPLLVEVPHPSEIRMQSRFFLLLDEKPL